MNQHLNSRIRTWAVLCHLSALTYLIPLFYLSNAYVNHFNQHLDFPISLVGWLVTMILGLWFTPHYVIWISQRKIHPFIDRQGREIKRFQLWAAQYILGPWILCLAALYSFILFGIRSVVIFGVRSFSPLVTIGAVMILLLTGLAVVAAGIISLILVGCHIFQIVVGADKASKGELHNYPDSSIF